MAKTKRYVLEMAETLHTRVKVRAIHQKITIRELMLRAVRNYLEETTDGRKQKA